MVWVLGKFRIEERKRGEEREKDRGKSDFKTETL